MSLKELVEVMVKALVDDPEAIEVKETKGSQSSMMEIRVSPGDLGKIIGRHGYNINAIRIITGAAAAKEKKKVVVDLIDVWKKDGEQR